MTLPHDKGAERALVGLALTTSGVSYDRVSDRIDAASFFDPECSRMWSAIARIRAAGDEVNEFVVAHALTGILDESIVLGFTNTIHPSGDDQRYARIVAELHQRRKLIAACTQASAVASDTSRPHSVVTQEAEKLIYESLRSVRTREPWKPLPELVETVKTQNAYTAAERGRIVGIKMGIEDLDWHLKGFRPGELIVIGGRTSDGKSSLALTCARNEAIRGVRSAYFSCEISGEDMTQRLLAAEGVTIADQESFDFYQADHSRNRIMAAYEAVKRLPIEVVYQPKITFPQIRTWCRRFLTTGPLGLIVIDYLALLGSTEKTDRRDREIAGFTAACLELAAEFGVPVIAIQSLNRRSAGDGKMIRPEVSHLMDSSAIEYDAHRILLLHNPNQSADGNAADTGEREVIIAKNRRGKRYTTVKVRLLGPRFLFVGDGEPLAPSYGREDHDDVF